MNETLAIHGGTPVRTTPLGEGARFGPEELNELKEALDQNTLFYFQGKKVFQFLNDFNHIYGVDKSVAVSSGTASLHVALGAAGISVGDEVIVPPVTDQGSLIGILYQNAIPVFADIDPHTYNLDPASIESSITDRTKAIIAVHLAGNPCDMDSIMDIAEKHGLIVIEDCAQSFLTYYKGKLAGTIGHYGCFSTNDFKHISTGEGGIIIVNSDDEETYQKVHAFADKNYNRIGKNNRDVMHLAPNYRMTELQGAVGIAQLKKLKNLCEQRNAVGHMITKGISDLPGVAPHQVVDENISSFWFYMFRLQLDTFTCSRDAFSKALQEEGIPNKPGYTAKDPYPVYMQPMLAERQAYKGTHFPFDLVDRQYNKGLCPVAEDILKTAVRLDINEFISEQDAKDIINAIRKVTHFYSK